MGGKAFEGITRRILKNEIHPTLKWLRQKWPDAELQSGNYMTHLLGSAGKAETSGDLDLNMRIELYDQAVVARQLTEFLGANHVKARPGNNQIFTAVPIQGDPSKGYVQVDFMFGNYAWQEFSYYSPRLVPGPKDFWGLGEGESCFKGLYRTELIKALVAFNSDWILEEDGELIARVGPTFFHDRGCVWRYRYRPMRQDGNGRVLAFKEVSKEQFLMLFPSALTATQDIITKPKQLVTMLVNEAGYEDSFCSLEGIWRTIRWYYSSEELDTIAKIYIERLNSLNVEIPKKDFARLGIKVA